MHQSSSPPFPQQKHYKQINKAHIKAQRINLDVKCSSVRGESFPRAWKSFRVSVTSAFSKNLISWAELKLCHSDKWPVRCGAGFQPTSDRKVKEQPYWPVRRASSSKTLKSILSFHHSVIFVQSDCSSRYPTGEAVEPPPEQGVSEIPAIRKPSKDTTWMGPKESAVRQHRQEMKTKMKTNKVEEVKPARPKQVRPVRRCDASRWLWKWKHWLIKVHFYWHSLLRSVTENMLSISSSPAGFVCDSVPMPPLWVLCNVLFFFFFFFSL